MELIDYIVEVFVMVDDLCKICFPSRNLRAGGPLPVLADSEVITMELVCEYLGFNTDQGIYRYFKRRWSRLFPNLPDRSNFVRQCANLWNVKQVFFEHISRHQDKYFQIIDKLKLTQRVKIYAKGQNQAYWLVSQRKV